MKVSAAYNWRNTLTEFASISGVLAGFCVAFIGLIIGRSIADIQVYQQLTFGHMAVLFFGAATSLFISASELFLHAKSFDIFGLTEDYRKWLTKGPPETDWDMMWQVSSQSVKTNEKYGRWSYNLAIFLLFIGLFFAIAPYNIVVALSVSAVGIVLESWQFIRGKESSQIAKEQEKRAKKPKLEDIVLSLWGVALAFVVQVLYDTFGNEFWTSKMPKVYWGLAISIGLSILLLFYIRRLRTNK